MKYIEQGAPKIINQKIALSLDLLMVIILIVTYLIATIKLF